MNYFKNPSLDLLSCHKFRSVGVCLWAEGEGNHHVEICAREKSLTILMQSSCTYDLALMIRDMSDDLAIKSFSNRYA